MFIDFNKEMRKRCEDRIPGLVVNHLSRFLPEGTKYEMDKDGNLVLRSTNDKLVISDLELEGWKQYVDKIGENPSKADILRYSYNAQKPLQFKPTHEGYLTINGQEIEIGKIKYNPLHEFKTVRGKFVMEPRKFADLPDVIVGGGEYERTIKVRRVPNDSLDEMEIQSEQEEPLQLKFFFNSRNDKFTINVTVSLKYCKTIQDVVDAIYIYNAFVDGNATINGEICSLDCEGKEIKKFNETYAVLWKKILEVENVLKSTENVILTPPEGDLDDRTIAMAEELYQSLILYKPVRRPERITSIGGAATLKEKMELDSLIGNKIFFVYPQRKRVEFLGATFDVWTLNGILDAVISDYKEENDRLIFTFEENENGEESFAAMIDFINEEGLENYIEKTGTELEQIFRAAEPLSNLVEAVFA